MVLNTVAVVGYDRHRVLSPCGEEEGSPFSDASLSIWERKEGGTYPLRASLSLREEEG
jgi:hypothetical protein